MRQILNDKSGPIAFWLFWAFCVIAAAAFWLVVASVAPASAQATGLVVGKECLLSWTPPTTATDGSFLAGPLAVTQASVYITTTATTPVQGTPTAALLPVGGVIPQQWGCAGVTPGQHWAWVSYSNVNGEGALSTSLPFVLSTAIPNGPSALTVK